MKMDEHLVFLGIGVYIFFWYVDVFWYCLMVYD